jgi:RNA-directed DNA polymerase
MGVNDIEVKKVLTRVKRRLDPYFYNYYGVTDNLRGIVRFEWEVKKLLFKWLNRRGKKNCLNWERFNEMLKRFPLPKPRIRVSMFGFSVN